MRCMYCGSKNIAMTTRNEGYSVAKGIAGQMLFGPGGSVMGVNGKKTSIYHCSACGKDQTMTMIPESEAGIDKALAENNISLLQHFKEMYWNLEWNAPLQQTYSDSSTRPKQTEKKTEKTKNQKIAQDINTISIEIREYFNEMNVPLSEEELVTKFSNYFQIIVIEAIHELKRKGKIKEVEEHLYVLVHDYEEMKQLAEHESRKNEIENKQLTEKASAYWNDNDAWSDQINKMIGGYDISSSIGFSLIDCTGHIYSFCNKRLIRRDRYEGYSKWTPRIIINERCAAVKYGKISFFEVVLKKRWNCIKNFYRK